MKEQKPNLKTTEKSNSAEQNMTKVGFSKISSAPNDDEDNGEENNRIVERGTLEDEDL